ncbi:flavoprotein [Pyrolobus fumarii 1A]|uniref:Flavoprotein n=1 Tax=Pyrolobus fumarii (strain DSM 11204 / 1A) TaxID=694429 RepID=G0EEP0_PYRF1|nr:flavoprotein [Pyrolobus fumarii]AEM38862.1 flavoprotein [Pyrolobus fumarii 1A]
MESCKSGARILWVVTGAGSWLREAAGIAAALAKFHRVTIALTKAGYEVARVFGALGLLRLAAPGGYYRELVVEASASGLPVVNRVSAKSYDLVVIAPASSNTIAKIAYGVADNLASSVASQALKNRVPLAIVPSEWPDGVETELPCRVDRNLCVGCKACIPVCPVGAITLVEGKARIELQECVGCTRCVAACHVGAIKCFDRVKVRPSRIDIENLERVKMYGVVVLERPLQILKWVSSMGYCVPGSSFIGGNGGLTE